MNERIIFSGSVVRNMGWVDLVQPRMSLMKKFLTSSRVFRIGGKLGKVQMTHGVAEQGQFTLGRI